MAVPAVFDRGTTSWPGSSNGKPMWLMGLSGFFCPAACVATLSASSQLLQD